MIQLYDGGFQIVRKSGVGQALLHQEKVLAGMETETTRKYRKDADIIHINTIFPDSLVRAWVAHMMGQKVIYYGHSTMEDFRNSFPGSNLFAPVFKKWITLCYNQGDLILTPTEYSRNLLLTYGLKKPVRAMSNGVDTDYFRPDASSKMLLHRKYNIPEEKKIVISAGHMIVRKGILPYIELARSMPDVAFLWFGHTPQKLITKEVARALEHRPSNLILAGFVEQDELLVAYQGADVFAFLSNEETEGIVVLEVLAAMIPTVLRDIPVYSGWLEDQKHVRKAKDESEIADCVAQALYGHNENMVHEGRKAAEDRNFQQIGYHMLSVYDELMNGQENNSRLETVYICKSKS